MNKNSIMLFHVLPTTAIRWQVGLLTAAFLFSISAVIPVMVKVWSRPDYSHGFLVPAISILFTWRLRHKLVEIPIKPSIIGGFAVLLIGVVGLVLASAGSVATVQLFALIVIVAGVELLMFGKEHLRALSLPILYLLFMVPGLDLVLDKVSWPLQTLDAKTVAAALGLFHVPVFQTGPYLVLPNQTLEIAAECSGTGFLVSFLAIGIPVAFFTQQDKLRRTLVVLYAVVCSVVANLIRITLIGFWTYHGGEFIHGPGHIFVGSFISFFGFLIFFAGVWIVPKQTGNKEDISVTNTKKTLDIPQSAKFNGALASALLILMCTGAYLHFYKSSAASVPVQFPDIQHALGVWSGQERQVEDALFRAPGADAEILRNYVDGKERDIQLYLAYFATQAQDKEVIHWTLQPLYNHTREIAIRTSNGRFSVNEAIVPTGPERSQVFIYWHIVSGKLIANRYSAKIATALNSVLERRTDGAIVIVSMNGIRNDEVKDAADSMIDFVSAVLPEMRKTPSLFNRV